MFSHKHEVNKMLGDADLSYRSSPHMLAGRPEDIGFSSRARRIGRVNIAYLEEKSRRNDGVVVGYHGTSTANAVNIVKHGFEDRRNVEGGVGVSAWDETAAMRAIEFARRRSEEAGAVDHGRIIRVRMLHPIPDRDFGRLEWLASADQTAALEVYTPEGLVDMLGGVAMERAQGQIPSQHQPAHGIV